MKKNRFLMSLLLLALLTPLLGTDAPADPARQIPDALKNWQDWAIWDVKDHDSPTPYQNASRHLRLWPSRLSLDTNPTGGRFEVTVTVFNETWFALPGSHETWPGQVSANGVPIPVLEHDGKPSVHLDAGTCHLSGAYHWDDTPQRISIPDDLGILSLTIDGKTIDTPAWDNEGFLWLKRSRNETTAEKDFLEVKVYRVIEDGIPMWLRSEIELSVSGKSREESLGGILPEGWQLAKVESPLPVAVDDQGRIKAQVRAGKWIIHTHAFRLNHAADFHYAPGLTPAVANELIAFRAKPDFRMVEVRGIPSIDVSQTTFPDQWRDLPVYNWENKSPFQLEERMRGMGLQKPEGLRINRDLWLDENGHSLVFRDRIAGNMQQIWRLDAAENQELGAVRSNGQNQLITKNPASGAPGIELRTRNLNLEATGRMDCGKGLSATGWRSDADNLSVTLNLPPGWRLLALFGADWVKGDWLTAWSLLDLFLLLIFSLAVFRLWGIGAGVLAFLAFGLAYHEPEAPRYVWLVLIAPLALLRVVPPGWMRRCVVAWKYLALAALIFVLAPFMAGQIQKALYPQLENNQGPLFITSNVPASMSNESPAVTSPQAEASLGEAKAVPTRKNLTYNDGTAVSAGGMTLYTSGGNLRQQQWKNSNLLYDNSARIQTGPAVPEWSWNAVRFGWNGPVSASQQVHPILISLTLERLLTLLRLALLLALALVLLEARRLPKTIFRIPGPALLALFLFSLTSAHAQLPDKETLRTLRERLLQAPDLYPAADIASLSLSLHDRKISMNAEIHTSLRCAVPLPGRLPSWSPLHVLVDGKSEAVLRRDDGYLWAVLPAGVHQVHVEGLLPDVSEWVCSFELKPRRVSMDAPGWSWNGVRPDGIPEQQIFLARQQKTARSETGYDHQDYHTVAALDRHLELGLVWQVHNQVTRLSPENKAVSLVVPLLPGEKVLTPNALVKNGCIEVRLGARENSVGWESELGITDQLHLATKAGDTWVEHWHLVASPVWSVTLSGLAPVFQADSADLTPVWNPWPGESVDLSINRPEPVNGATITVRKAVHHFTPGSRQRSSSLDLDLQCSLGEDFIIGLPGNADITSLTLNNSSIPVRKDGNNLILPVQPGNQAVSIHWKTNQPLGLLASADALSLPVEAANISTVLHPPENRWVLWTHGPQRGPAVRFWGILVCSLLAAWVLGRLTLSPLRSAEWMLLALGLTQIPLAAALAVIGWFFFLTWRGRDSFQKLPGWGSNVLQIILVLLSLAVLGIFVGIVSEGLLGNPDMFILGNGSTRDSLQWYQDRSSGLLPQAGFLSVSIWWYRFLMLLWALWLASALLRWLKWGWDQFSRSGCFRPWRSKPLPPPLA